MFGKKTPPELPQDLLDRMERCEKAVRDIRVDWDETFEKFTRLHQRMAKRVRDAQKADEKALGDTNSDGAKGHINPLANRLLNPYGGK